MERRCRSEPCAGWAMSPNPSPRSATVIRALGQRLALRSKLRLFLGALSLGGTSVLAVAALEYGRRAADQVYDQLLAGSALAIADTVNVIERKIEADLHYATLDMLSMAHDARDFYGIAAPSGESITDYSDLPAHESIGFTGHPPSLGENHSERNGAFGTPLPV